MKQGVAQIGGLVMLGLLLSVAGASAQDAAGGPPRLRWSIEGAAGVQLDYGGTIQSVAFGFAPSRSLTVLIGAERSRTDGDDRQGYPHGYASERVEFVRAEVRFSFFTKWRVSPYAVVGGGGGVERHNKEFFPHGDKFVVVICSGGGARIPIHRRLDAFVDWRLIVTMDEDSEMGGLEPLRAGLAFRF
jgi:hypothetical protein